MKQVFTLLLVSAGITVFAQEKTAKTATATPPVKETKQVAPAPVSAASRTAPGELQKPATPPSTETQAMPDPRTAATSSQVRTVQPAPLPYDVNDKYMGRKDEFLNDITLPELPADFPVYDKQWSLKEYNQVVDAYFINHKDILKERVREKVELLQQR